MAPVPNIRLTCVVALIVLLPVEIVSADVFPELPSFMSSVPSRLYLPRLYRASRISRPRLNGLGPLQNNWSTPPTLYMVPKVDQLIHNIFPSVSTSTLPPTLPPTPSPVPSPPPKIRHVDQRSHEQRPDDPPKQETTTVPPVAKHVHTTTAPYHDNHRHQIREAATQRYQHLTTTPSTYRRHHPGRRVCTGSVPNSSLHGRHSSQLRYYNYIHIQTDTATSFSCCPGWTQATQLSFGCNKHIDECVSEKPCDQLCRNLAGSYECHCKPGFQLQKDGQSCRKNDTDDIAFEARDLEEDFHEVTTTKHPSTSPHDTENEVADDDLDQDYEIILKRLTKLEKLFAKGKKKDTETTEMNAKVASVMENIGEMKRTVENVQSMQYEIYEMRTKLREYELETRKVQHLTNRVMELESRLRLRCRTAIPMNSHALHF